MVKQVQLAAATEQGLALHKDVSSAGETGSWAKGLPFSCSDRPGFAKFSYLIWNSTYSTEQPNRASSF